MGGHDIIVIGASAGGMKALETVLAALPAGLQAAVFVVLHIDRRSQNLLAEIFSRHAHLRIATASDGEDIAYGEVRIARADFHLQFEDGRVSVAQGPKENRSRPAVDTLFRSAATAFGSRVIGVVLTGNLDDGTAGLWAIKRAGGLAVVQDPAGAEYPDMPKNAQDGVAVDHCVPLEQIASLLSHLTSIPASGDAMPIEADHEIPGVVYVCPDCDGPLREIKTGTERLVRFRCLVGHAFSMMSLLEGHTETREAALWSAVVALEHEAMLAERAAQVAGSRGDTEQSAAMNSEAVRARAQGLVIRDLLKSPPSRQAGDPD